MEKLFLVTRSDLAPGLRAAQLCHAMREFAELHPEIEKAWYRSSNNLVLLEVEDEAALMQLAARGGAYVALNKEPDLDDAVTAVALMTTEKKLVRELPLALRAA